MTHTAWERGERLTIHNATNEQLKQMIIDRDAYITRLTAQIKAEREKREKLIEFCAGVIRLNKANR
jgi:hypothetical protein